MPSVRLPNMLISVVLLIASSASALDRVRITTGTDAARARYGVTGKGVLIAILDRGIDYTHPDFRNLDGSSRILYMYDLTDDRGAKDPANTFGRGTIYTKVDIDRALRDGTALGARDSSGHGTASTGLICGNGRASNGKYSGIAPEAGIIVVKLVAPDSAAHDDQPAEIAFYDPAVIPIAFTFVIAKMHELSMPCAVLINIGSIGGPTDGTSPTCKWFDSMVGAGIPGFAIINGSGDDGGAPNRVVGMFRQDASQSIRIQKGDPGPLYLDFWYPDSDTVGIEIETPLGRTALPALVSNRDATSLEGTDFAYYQYGSYWTENQKRAIYLRIKSGTGLYTVRFAPRLIVNGRYYGSLNPALRDYHGISQNQFLDSVFDGGSIGDGGSAHNIIIPNCSVNRDVYTDVDGRVQTLAVEQGVLGGLWLGGSVGPTMDGRLGIDFVVPGQNVVTTYNPKSLWGTSHWLLISDGNGLYGMHGAASAAAPIATGLVALVLQANPTLDASEIKSILQQSSVGDVVTGTVPNPKWGYGRINISRAVVLACAKPGCTVKVRRRETRTIPPRG